MYSLVYCQDVKEYYICNTRNVIQQEDGVCLVAFRAQLVLTDCASKHYLRSIQKHLGENPLLNVQVVDENEEAVDTIVSMDLLPENDIPDVDKFIEATDKTENDKFSHVEKLNCIDDQDVKTEQHDEISPNQTENLDEVEEAENTEIVSEKNMCPFCKQMYEDLNKHIMQFHESTQRSAIHNNNQLETDEELNDLAERRNNKASARLRMILTLRPIRHKLKKMISSDKMFKLFGNAQCKKSYSNMQIRSQLQVLANILTELRKLDSEITDLSSVFHPVHIKTVDSLQNQVQRSYGILYLVNVGNFLMQYYTKKNEFRKKKDAEEALKFLAKKGKAKYRIISVKNEKILHVPMIIKTEQSNKENKVNLIETLTFHFPIGPKKEGNAKEEEVNPIETPKKPYPLRKRSENYQRFIEEMQINEIIDSLDESDKVTQNKQFIKVDNKKYLFCYFCEKLYVKAIAGHLERMHPEEEEVKNFCSFQKGSPERKRIIADIVRKGKLKYNSMEITRSAKDLVSRKPKQPKRNQTKKNIKDETTSETVPDLRHKSVHVIDAETETDELFEFEEFLALGEVDPDNSEDKKSLICMLDEHKNCSQL